MPTFPEDPSAVALTSYLNEVMRLAGDRLWDCPPLLQFLDDKYGQSKLEALQMKRLGDKVLCVVVNFVFLVAGGISKC